MRWYDGDQYMNFTLNISFKETKNKEIKITDFSPSYNVVLSSQKIFLLLFSLLFPSLPLSLCYRFFVWFFRVWIFLQEWHACPWKSSEIFSKDYWYLKVFKLEIPDDTVRTSNKFGKYQQQPHRPKVFCFPVVFEGNSFIQLCFLTSEAAALWHWWDRLI